MMKVSHDDRMVMTVMVMMNNYMHLMRRVLSSMKVGRMSDVDKDDESGDGNDSAQEKNEDDGD